VISSAELVILKPYHGRFLIKADLFQIGGYPVRYSGTKFVLVAKRTFRISETPSFSGTLVAQRKGHPVEGHQARNEETLR
jgi:hypothetical protein